MNRITTLFGIQYPIIQGGMVWCSGWRLASAVSNNGGLGLLGAGSMHPDTLIEHIHKMKAATSKPWGVNVPLLYPEIDRLMEILIQEEVKIVFNRLYFCRKPQEMDLYAQSPRHDCGACGQQRPVCPQMRRSRL